MFATAFLHELFLDMFGKLGFPSFSVGFLHNFFVFLKDRLEVIGGQSVSVPFVEP